MVLVKVFVALLAAASTGAQMMRKDKVRERQAEAVKRWQGRPGPAVLHDSAKRSAAQNITFSNPKASEFWVNGSALPLVDFDVGPSWAGLLPISNSPDETRQVGREVGSLSSRY
ncbi:hypothetical protein BS17DRAFT_766568 [Gyrodon lividus]|nr:hypothetical protein BS17DRAFT_766568 [Gyrodon lividus]